MSVKLTEKKVMITGGAGFIGSHLTDRLLELENEVVVYDNFDDYYTGKRENLKKVTKSPRFKLIEADILDHKKLSASISDVDIVFHLAAQPGVRFSTQNPWKTNKVNVDGTLNVLLASLKSDVEKIVVASSSSVYGVPIYLPCDENHPTQPISLYGASKLAAEKYCDTFFRIFKLPVTVLRYHTVYGPRQRPDMAIYKFAEALFHGNPPIIFGDGNQTRDFTYVSDAVEGTILAAESEDSTGERFNIGSGSKVSVNYVVELMKKLMDRVDINQVYISPQIGDVPETQADIRKARENLGYCPKWSFDEGLKTFLESHFTKKR